MTVKKEDAFTLARAWLPVQASDEMAQQMAPMMGDSLEAATRVVQSYGNTAPAHAPTHVIAATLAYIVGMHMAKAKPNKQEFVAAVSRMYEAVHGMFTAKVEPKTPSLVDQDGKPLN